MAGNMKSQAINRRAFYKRYAVVKTATPGVWGVNDKRAKIIVAKFITWRAAATKASELNRSAP